MKVVVTGGLGYLGSHVVDVLEKNAHEAIVIDNNLYNADGATVRLDIRDKKIADHIKNSDAVIHLAGIIGYNACDINSEVTRAVNFEATKKIVNICKENNVRLLYASTCSVYGNAGGSIAINENELNKANPISLYGETKKLSEEAIVSSGIDFTILRLGTLFGLSERMRFDLVINLFIAQALNKEKLAVFGGQQWRPFLHVNDAAKSFVYMLEKNRLGVYNVAWNNLRIVDIAEIISKELGVEYSVDENAEDERNYKVDLSKINSIGLSVKKDIKYAIDEMRQNSLWRNYRAEKYDNYKFLLKNGVK